jgi:uncharacterized protein
LLELVGQREYVPASLRTAIATSTMITPFSPLSDDELQELDNFMLYEVACDESMTLDTLDGYLHAIAIGPVTLHPRQWMPGIWGEGDSIMPPVESIEKLNRILGLVMRLFNSIIAALEDLPREIYPLWNEQEYRGKEYDDAEGWANGFCDGVKLCQREWQPLLDTPQGQAWYRPLGLLGEDDFVPEQDALTKTPAMRGKLALQIPAAVVAMYEHWLPYRQALYEREVAKTLQEKVGRNESCPCGSGKKFKKCCGAAADLH